MRAEPPPFTRARAKYRYEERYNEVKSVVITGLFFRIVTSLVIIGLMHASAQGIRG